MILTGADIVEWLEESDPEKVESLFRSADRERGRLVGDEIHVRGIVEFSNYCKRNCLYCGLRKSNERLARCRMGLEEIFEAAREAAAMDFKTIVLQSGEDDAYSADDLCRLVARIKKELNLSITLAVGEKSFDDYRKMKEAGADRYLLKFETSSPSLFRALKPDSSYAERFRCLEWLRESGFQVGSGNMIGLPGQTSAILAEDILTFRKMDLDMIGVGPFIPHPETPLAHTPGGTVLATLKTVAITRLAAGSAHIPATTALGTIDPEGRQKALRCGANVVMPNVTPLRFRKQYEIYPNKLSSNESPAASRDRVASLIASVGRSIASDFGHSLKIRT
ncbi:MAG TPA: [FeFe] hydrogenase H-cluster radical SAM maturase HydE [Thermodesulfobacteriota bacterium]|nr:[FeFe] hydrogenase H-cluster radical SAM maturase HydE [Thermodesulfobacteriota bacterium]